MRSDVTDLAQALRRAARPPLRGWSFWLIQLGVLVVAAGHLGFDFTPGMRSEWFPSGLPMSLLLFPVGYAAMRYGSTGAIATAAWATFLWLPELVLGPEEGHAGSDIVNLALVDAVAIYVGRHIEIERGAQRAAWQASARFMEVQARYRQVFLANVSPILVLDGARTVVEANPAARALFPGDVVGQGADEVLATLRETGTSRDVVVDRRTGREYRVNDVPAPTDGGSSQIIFEDVTEERRTGRRVTRYAQLLVAAEEEQRLRLSRELHDEPLQLFLHLAQRLESLSGVPGVPPDVAGGLVEARVKAVDAAVRLRSLARDLRPPALDQLGLVAALSSLLDTVEEETGVTTELRVAGTRTRLPADVELAAFRIVHEAVRNTVRHAAARRVAVEIEFTDETVHLTIGDDGRGFATRPDDSVPEHLGLIGMSERAHLLGGRLEVRSALGSGTLVDVTLPSGGAAASRRKVSAPRRDAARWAAGAASPPSAAH